MLSQIILAVVALLAIALTVGLSYYFKPVHTILFFERRIEFIVRWWNFWGPRLSDRNLISMLLANGAALGIVTLSHVQLEAWSLGLWLLANLLNPTWDSHPAGETLAPKSEPDLLLSESATGH